MAGAGKGSRAAKNLIYGKSAYHSGKGPSKTKSSKKVKSTKMPMKGQMMDKGMM